MSARLKAALLLTSLAAALAASFRAQHWLRDTASERGLPFVAAALVLAVVAGRLLTIATVYPAPPAPSLRPQRPGRLVVGVAALALVLVLQASSHAPGLQLAAWALSLCAWIAAYRTEPWSLRREPQRVRLMQAALLALALCSCLYALDRIPGGLYGDEGAHGSVVRDLLAGRMAVPPFSFGWGRVPTLFTWLEAAGVAVAGTDMRGLRLTAAIGGALCVLPWFGLLRRDLGNVAAAASALLLLGSPAHQHLSRIALPESWIRLCAFAALGALYAALRGGRAVAYVGSGVALGACFYMASKAVLLPPIMLGAALFLIIATLPGSLRQWSGALLVLAAAALAFLPELSELRARGFYLATAGHADRWLHTPHPGGSTAQALEVSRLLLDGLEGSPFSPSFVAPTHIVSEVEGALAVVGLGLCVARPRWPIAAFLLGWLAAGLASLLLDGAPNQLPHAILISCLPSALGAIVMYALHSGATQLTGRPALGALAVAACAVPLALGSASAYFGRGAGAAPWALADVTALGKAMQEHRATHHVALVTPPMSWDMNSSLLYLAPDFLAPTKLTELPSQRPWLSAVERDVAFLVLAPSVQRLLPRIRTRYPNAPVELRKSAAGDLLLAIVRVPADEVRRAEQALH